MADLKDGLKGKPGPKAVPFWDRVDVPDDDNACWEWQGSCFSNGYGRAIVNRKSRGAHRVSWELTTALPIPDGVMVCHRCDNRKCVRPDHLFLGTARDNLHDMVSKGRSLKGSRNPNAVLTETAAAEIRRRYGVGDATQLSLAEQYGVVEGAIWNVLHNRTWEAA